MWSVDLACQSVLKIVSGIWSVDLACQSVLFTVSGIWSVDLACQSVLLIVSGIWSVELECQSVLLIVSDKRSLIGVETNLGRNFDHLRLHSDIHKRQQYHGTCTVFLWYLNISTPTTLGSCWPYRNALQILDKQ